MSKYKPEWYEVVWTLGINGKEQSKMFTPDKKDEAMKFYDDKIKEVMKVPYSNVIIYLTHTNRLYDIIDKRINRG